MCREGVPEAVGSCVVWWEGVVKLSGLVLCGGKAC
jgi:hypothetical protein